MYNNLLIKKKRYIELLHKNNYKVINDDCGRDKESRLYGKNYRSNWLINDKTKVSVHQK